MPKPITKHDITIADGEAGIFETVNYMWNYALRDAKEPLVKELVKSLAGRDKLETLQNIFDYVISNVSYKLDPADREMVTAPIHYVNGNRNTGDCDCMTTLLVCLLEAAGFESAITVIAWRSEDFTHVFAEVKCNGNWYVLDPTLSWSGYLRQDKKIIRQKRTEKKDMAKLTVLADAGTPPRAVDAALSGLYKGSDIYDLEPTRRGNRSRSSNCNRNDNGNNINIHFGNIGTRDIPVFAPSVSNTEVSADRNAKVAPGGWKSIDNSKPDADAITNIINELEGNANNNVTAKNSTSLAPARASKSKAKAKFYPEFP